MYCIKCGVELADSEKVCPLCGTRVFHPDLPCGSGEPPYPPAEHLNEEVSRVGALFVVTVCMLLPAVISVLVDWRVNGGIVWSGFVLGGLALLYVLAVLPLWFKRPNPVIFVPVDFAAIGVYLLYVDLATRGGWFFSFALPVTGAAMVLVTAVVTLLRYVPSGALYTLGGGLILAGGFNVLVEFLLNLTFHLHDTFLWSFYPLAVCVELGAMLLVIAAVAGTVNRRLGTDFLFLAAPPAGTPLEAVFEAGYPAYLAFLFAMMLALCLIMDALAGGWKRRK